MALRVAAIYLAIIALIAALLFVWAKFGQAANSMCHGIDLPLKKQAAADEMTQ